MKYARRAHRKLRKRIIGVADDLLVRGIDITAAINNPVETLRGRPTISGRKIAKYLESTKPMEDPEENKYSRKNGLICRQK